MFHWKEYKELIEADERLLASTRNQKYPLGFKDRVSPEVRINRWYRLAMVNRNNIFGKGISYTILKRMESKYGVMLSRNHIIGPGFLIGHWGRIILNANATFGEDFVISNNVNVGMDMRGKRAGVPTFGNRVCIHSNSTVVGGIKIGNDVVIAPNTFVNFDVPDHSIVIGNPATIHYRENATEGYIGFHN